MTKFIIALIFTTSLLAANSNYRACGDDSVITDNSYKWSINHCLKINGVENSTRVFEIDGEEVELLLQAVYYHSPKQTVCWGNYFDGNYEEVICE